MKIIYFSDPNKEKACIEKMIPKNLFLEFLVSRMVIYTRGNLRISH